MSVQLLVFLTVSRLSVENPNKSALVPGTLTLSVHPYGCSQGSLQLVLLLSCCVPSQVLMSDSTREAALREEQCCLLICSELATSPLRAQFNRLLGLLGLKYGYTIFSWWSKLAYGFLEL